MGLTWEVDCSSSISCITRDAKPEPAGALPSARTGLAVPEDAALDACGGAWLAAVHPVASRQAAVMTAAATGALIPPLIAPPGIREPGPRPSLSLRSDI